MARAFALESGGGSLALYRRLIGARVRADLTYRFSFALRVLSAMLVTALDYVAIWALVSKVDTIGGWDRWQVTYLYGASSVAFRAADAFIGGPVERCSQYVRVGTFDSFGLFNHGLSHSCRDWKPCSGCRVK